MGTGPCVGNWWDGRGTIGNSFAEEVIGRSGQSVISGLVNYISNLYDLARDFRTLEIDCFRYQETLF